MQMAIAVVLIKKNRWYCKSLDKQNATVVEIDKKQKKSFSPGLYDLTELQRDANKSSVTLLKKH